jgi:hypothetical protein
MINSHQKKISFLYKFKFLKISQMEVDQAKDPKNMSLDALIKMDKKKPGTKGGNKKTDRPNTARSGKGGP